MPVRSVPVDAATKPYHTPTEEIEWTITSPNHHLEDMILDEETRGQIEDAVSYYQQNTKTTHKEFLVRCFDFLTL